MAPPPPVADRTETLAPRESSSRGVAAAPVASPTGADDPERYEQIGEHARGGLGRIVRAVDKRLGRTVAVKELLRPTTSNEARFMREALITARLEHPGIVPVHEAGRWPNGDPYYVMKLVEGRTLKELIAERLTMRDRLGLLPHVLAVADAVGYAHAEGVIHRDLKPSNVVVGNFGETMVVDWGLARDRKRPDLPEVAPCEDNLAAGSGSVSTVSGKVVGTPAYMAPEQARGEQTDERSDVYAIGAVLYELLAGTPAHADATPQATLERVIAGPPEPLATAVAHVPVELGTIVAKAMARAPADRYPNATALAEDLRSFSTGKLVSAHSYSAWSLVRKKLAQHRGVVAVALASALALGVVGVGSFRRVVHERNIAMHERGRTEDALSQAEKRKRELVLLQALTSLRKDPTATIAWLKTLAIANEDRAQVVGAIDEAVAMGVALHVFRPGDWALDAAFTRDGTSVIAAVRDGVLRKYDLRTGHMTRLGAAPSAPEVLALTPDGSSVITGGTTGEVIAWPLAGGAPRLLLPASGRVAMSLRFSPDGTRVLVDRDRGSLDVVSVALAGGTIEYLGATGSLRTTVADADWSKQVVMTAPNALAVVDANKVSHPLATTQKGIRFFALSPHGEHVLVHDGSMMWIGATAGGPLKPLAPYEAEMLSLSWSPDGKRVILVGHEHDVVLVELATGTVRRLRGHTDALYTVAWSPDGTRLLSASDDATARVWSVADGSSEVLRGHDDDIYRARWSPDGRMVATASFDGSVRVWPVERAGAQVLTEGASVTSLTLVGDTIAVQTPVALARWNLATGKREVLFAWGEDGKTVGTPVASSGGDMLAAPHADWSMELRRKDAPPLQLVGHKAALSRIAFARDGKTLYSASLDGTLRAWSTSTGAVTKIIEGSAPVRGFALARDGRIAAQVGDELVMITNGRREVIGAGPAWCVIDAEFDRVKDRLLINRCDRSFALVVDGRAIELADGYMFNRIAISNDGSRIAGAMGDRTIRIWDATTGQQLTVLRGHSDLVMDLAFSPDDHTLASGSYDRTIRVWELGTQRSRVIRGHAAAVDQVAWRDRDHLLTGSRDGTLRLWNVPPLALPTNAQLAARLTAASSARIELDRPTTPDGV